MYQKGLGTLLCFKRFPNPSGARNGFHMSSQLGNLVVSKDGEEMSFKDSPRADAKCLEEIASS